MKTGRSERRWVGTPATVAAAPAVVGASRLLRPPQRQRRPGVPTHICSQRPVFTESHFTQPKQSNLLSQNEFTQPTETPLCLWYDVFGPTTLYINDNEITPSTIKLQYEITVFCDTILDWNRTTITLVFRFQYKSFKHFCSLCRCTRVTWQIKLRHNFHLINFFFWELLNEIVIFSTKLQIYSVLEHYPVY